MTDGRPLEASPPAGLDRTIVSAADGLELAGRYWPAPSGEPAGRLVISHGLGEHSACYAETAAALVDRLGIDVLGFDYRGHGRSPGLRGVVGRYEELIGDLEGALAWARSARPGRPLFLLGHSNGGVVAARAAIERRPGLDGLILSNPAIRLATRVPGWKRGLGRLLLRLAPGVTLHAPLPLEHLSRDASTYPGRLADDLAHKRISAPLFFGMIEGGAGLLEQAGRLDLPVLLLLGGADPVVDPDAGRAFFERVGSADKTLRVYPESVHEPLRDLDRDRVLDDMAAWLRHRLGRPSA